MSCRTVNSNWCSQCLFVLWIVGEIWNGIFKLTGRFLTGREPGGVFLCFCWGNRSGVAALSSPVSNQKLSWSSMHKKYWYLTLFCDALPSASPSESRAGNGFCCLEKVAASGNFCCCSFWNWSGSGNLGEGNDGTAWLGAANPSVSVETVQPLLTWKILKISMFMFMFTFDVG